MKVRIERGINEKGNNFYILFVDNIKSNELYSASRLLTNTDSEGGTGIWSDECSFRKGEYSKIFNFGKSLDIKKDSLETIKEELIKRSKRVRGWVNSLPYKEEIEFTVSE